MGSLVTDEIAERMMLNSLNIASFIDNSDQNCLEIY
jgi:hypothetical protein